MNTTHDLARKLLENEPVNLTDNSFVGGVLDLLIIQFDEIDELKAEIEKLKRS